MLKMVLISVSQFWCIEQCFKQKVLSSLCYQVNEFLAGAGTDAPDVEEENIISRPSVSYDDMWAKTLLETTEMEVQIFKNFFQQGVSDNSGLK